MSFGKVAATAYAVPDNIVTNDDLSRFLDTSDEWISTRTGIKSRYISDGENTTDLAEKVSRSLLMQSGITPEEIGLILVASVTGDYITPATACVLQGRLGAVNAMAFDINAACAGFVHALTVADHFIQSGMCRHVLVIGAECLSKITNWEDRSTCVLFGDGAGGVLLSACDQQHLVSANLHADGTKYQAIIGGGSHIEKAFHTVHPPEERGVIMNGREVLEFALRRVPASIEALGIPDAKVDFYLLHQANLRIIQGVAKRMKLSMEKFYVNIERFGNTSAASIPIALAEMVEQKLITLGGGQNIVLSAFGSGLVWGSALLTL